MLMGEKNVSTGYKIDENGVFQSPKLADLTKLYGAGDISMSTTDMYLFDKALMDKKLISEASLKKNVHIRKQINLWNGILCGSR